MYTIARATRNGALPKPATQCTAIRFSTCAYLPDIIMERPDLPLLFNWDSVLDPAAITLSFSSGYAVAAAADCLLSIGPWGILGSKKLSTVLSHLSMTSAGGSWPS